LAARSKRSAQKRAKWIVAELDRIERFQKSPSELIADTGAAIGWIISSATAIVMVVQVSAMLILFSLLLPERQAIDPSYTAPYTGNLLKIFALVTTGIILPFVFRVSWEKYTLAINRDLEKR
jgi:hypothetical protein